MSRGDLSVIGVSGGAHPYKVAASATRGYAGEPINNLSVGTAGVGSVNTVVVMTDTKPRIGTDAFVGVAAQNMKVNSAGTVVAHTLNVVVPIPEVTRIRGKAKTAASVDTDSELLGLLWDYVDFDLTSGVYTIDEAAAADASALTVKWGNPAKGTLDVTVSAIGMRTDTA